MRDYMKALHLRFEDPSRQALELERRADALHKQLASRLAKPERRMLLRLVNLENELRGQSDLDSFMSGFRLADGIQQELMEQPPYSFELEDERCAESGATSVPDRQQSNRTDHRAQVQLRHKTNPDRRAAGCVHEGHRRG